MNERLVTEDELVEMEALASKVSTGDRWTRLCQEVRRLWAVGDTQCTIDACEATAAFCSEHSDYDHSLLAEVRGAGCQCADDDACAFAAARDEWMERTSAARVENARLLLGLCEHCCDIAAYEGCVPDPPRCSNCGGKL